MISVTYSGGLGDRLFQYAFGRVLAERFGYRLNAPGIWGCPATYAAVEGDVVVEPELFWKGHFPVNSQARRPIPESALLNRPDAQVHLIGQFQHYGLFATDAERIRSSRFGIAPGVANGENPRMLICLAPPRGDAGEETAWSGASLESLLAIAGGTNVEVLTTSRSLAIPRVLDGRMEKVHRLPALGALRLMLGFRVIAMTQHPLFWWGAFLSKASEVYFANEQRDPVLEAADPRSPQLRAAHERDLFVPDRRYIYDWER